MHCQPAWKASTGKVKPATAWLSWTPDCFSPTHSGRLSAERRSIISRFVNGLDSAWDGPVMKAATSSQPRLDAIAITAKALATPLSVAEIRKIVPLSRPTLYRLLETLVATDMLHAEGNPQRFRLGRAIAVLGRAWSEQLEIDALARPIVDELRDSTGETCGLFEIRNGQQFCVLESKSRHALSMSRGVRALDDGFHGASGIAILAWLDPEDAVNLARSTSPAGLPPISLEELTKARKAGFAISHGAIFKGATSIAAPVFDASGKLYGSLALFGPEARIRDEGLDKHIALIRDAARRLSNELGAATPD